MSPRLRARYFHPIGILAREIQVGDSCSKVRSRMANQPALQAKDIPNDAHGLRFSEFDADTRPLFTHVAASYKGLRLYDIASERRIELTVFCAPPDDVVRVLFSHDAGTGS